MTDNRSRKRGFRPINRTTTQTPPPTMSQDINPAVRKRIRPVNPMRDLEHQRSEASPERYEIGYKKPPKHGQFQPGQSGNPKGRKQGTRGMKTLARETLTAKVTVRTTDGTKKMARIEALMHKFIELAMKGNPRAMLALFSMYESAIPDRPDLDARDVAVPPLTETDEAILAELRTLLMSEGEVK
jgi:Family of unknown function (DUF5681)